MLLLSDLLAVIIVGSFNNAYHYFKTLNLHGIVPCYQKKKKRIFTANPWETRSRDDHENWLCNFLN